MTGRTINRRYHAIVLAGSRGGQDPVSRHAGAACKALVRVGGRPMLARVLSALADSRSISGITVVALPDEAVGDPELASALDVSDAVLEPGAESPAASVAQVLPGVPEQTAVLVTTADHALLTAKMVDGFLAGAEAADADAVIGLAPYEQVMMVAPGSRRTVTRLRDGNYCGCNLFALLSPRGRAAVDFWRRLEAQRKHPSRLARALGIGTMLRYIFRRLTLEDVMQRLSGLAGAKVRAVLLSDGRAAIDVDKPEDLDVAQSLVSGRDSA